MDRSNSVILVAHVNPESVALFHWNMQCVQMAKLAAHTTFSDTAHTLGNLHTPQLSDK